MQGTKTARVGDREGSRVQDAHQKLVRYTEPKNRHNDKKCQVDEKNE